MKKIALLSCSILIGLVCADAQTKRIEHRSHSGSNASFDLKNSSNFGVVPHPFSTQTAMHIDSIIRQDSIYRHWSDSLYRSEMESNRHAMQTPATHPPPGKGAAAGAAAAAGF